LPNIPAVDHSADYQFVSRSAGNTPEKIRAALEGEGIFIKDITEQTDERPPEKKEEPVKETPKAPEAKPAEEKAEPAKPAEPAEPADKAAEHKKAAPGVKERQRAKIAELTSEAATVKAELEAERRKRADYERELAEWKAGKAIPAPETAIIAAKPEEPVIKQEAKPRPRRPPLPKEEDFWEKPDPAQALKAAQAEHEAALEKYEEDLTDWRLDERERVKREAEEAKTKKEAADNFSASNEADRLARVERWKQQVTEAEAKHPDFTEKLGSAKPFSEAMIHAAHAMDRTAEIGYYLATHPEESEALVKATELPKNPTQSQINRAMKTAFVEYAAIEKKLAALDLPQPDDDEDDPDEPDEEDVTAKTVVNGAPPVTTESPKSDAPAKIPPQAEATPVKKYTPVTPVGGRGGKAQKTYAELAKSNDAADMAELRAMSLDEVRRRQKTGT
jgi:hypothetical protein